MPALTLTLTWQVTTNRYANAFNQDPSAAGHKDDTVTTSPEPTYCENGAVYENKYELDSLVNVLQLSNEYFKWTKDLTCFSGQQELWLGSAQAIIETIVAQQSSTSEDFTKPSELLLKTASLMHAFELQCTGPITFSIRYLLFFIDQA